MECLRDICPDDVLHFIPPFTRIDQWSVPFRSELVAGAIKLVTTAMLRDGDKFASFMALAHALGLLIKKGVTNWHLTIVGDGPARNRVEALFDDQGIAANQVMFAGLCAPTETRDILAKSDLFVWPAINEAFGMAMLEAQASGLPVLAGDAGGVSGIVSNGLTGWLVPENDPVAFADRLESCLTADIAALRPFGRAGASKASQHHTLSAAANILGASLRKIAANHRKDGE
jgi:glycosyltransferase involved in cell wall biosynthesis